MLWRSGTDLIFFPHVMRTLVKISQIISHPHGNVIVAVVAAMLNLYIAFTAFEAKAFTAMKAKEKAFLQNINNCVRSNAFPAFLPVFKPILNAYMTHVISGHSVNERNRSQQASAMSLTDMITYSIFCRFVVSSDTKSC
uniref:Uncharacterized protein n=1 Tax=Glossina austeni TaxID=7395 RepID=A0A1A9UPP6_GLOAU